MKLGTRVKLTADAQRDRRDIGGRIGTISDGNSSMVAIDFDGLDFRVWLPASNVEEITDG